MSLDSRKRQCTLVVTSQVPALPQPRKRTNSADVPTSGLANLAKVQALMAQPLQTVTDVEGSVATLKRKKRKLSISTAPRKLRRNLPLSQ